MSVLLANNAATNLAAAITGTDTAITVSAGAGDLFPTPGAGQWFPVALITPGGVIEFVRCTARSGDTLTVTRAQEGTSARAFAAGDRVELRLTAGALAEFARLLSPELTGNPRAPTPAATDNDTSIATTAFVRAAMGLFGMGANTPAYTGNIDLPANVPKGWAFCSSAIGTTGTLPTPYGILWSGGITDDGFIQEWYEIDIGATTKRRHYRTVYNGALGPWRELWHTGNLVKQSSPTDTTAGALMMVEAGGWLGRAAYGSYIDGYPTSFAENISQIYRRETVDTGVVAHAASMHFASADTWGRLRVGYYSPGAWIQGGLATVGTGWTVELYHSDNWYRGADKQHTANATGTVALDLAAASIFDLTLTGNVTITISNATVPAGETRSIVVRIRQGSTPYTLTWWPGITWLAATTPAAPGANKITEYVLSYSDAGWLGRVGAKT